MANKETMTRFMPCGCAIDGDHHIPAIIIVVVLRADPVEDIIEELYIEFVRLNYKTHDMVDAHQQAVADYESALSLCTDDIDWEKRAACIASALVKKGYELMPRDKQKLLFDCAVPNGVIH